MADLRMTRAMLQSLRSILQTRTPKKSDERLYSLMTWAIAKPARIDAVAAAVQTLRDVGEITRAEAAYMIDYLIDLPRDNRELDPGISKLIVESPEHHDLAMAAMSHHDTMLGVEFYKAHGEFELAELFENDIDAYRTLCAEGQISLYDYKEDHHPRVKEAKSKDPSVVMEKVIAMSATEGIPAWLPAWKEFCSALHEVTPETAVVAIQNARELGVITYAQSASLIDDAITDLFWHEAALDREHHRLEQAMEVMDEQLGIKYETPDDQQPFEWRVLNAQMERRKAGITAVILRRLGEHRMASLLVNDPDGYARLLDEGNLITPGPDTTPTD
jgi:hypothetical protein